MERFVIIVNGWKPLTIIIKHSILDVPAVLDPSLVFELYFFFVIMDLKPRTYLKSRIYLKSRTRRILPEKFMETEGRFIGSGGFSVSVRKHILAISRWIVQ